jgi:copper chaperone NosL
VKAQTAALLAAAALTAISLALPLWGFRMSAPQYPEESLHLRVTRSAVTGDVHEVTTLQKYIGVTLPTDLPELRWLTPAIAALTLLLVAGAILGGSFGRGFRVFVAAVFLLFLAGSAGVLQKRLYDVGHHRKPNAPITAIHDFTPPLLGPVHVGNFTVWSYPHVGAGLLVAALGLAMTVVSSEISRRRPAVSRGAAA